MEKEVAGVGRIGVIWLSIWFCLNVAIGLVNKAVFKFFLFPSPIVLTVVHMFIISIASNICVVIAKKKQLFPVRRIALPEYKLIGIISVLFGANVLMGNLLLKQVDISLIETLRATVPVFKMVLSIYILNQTYTRLHVIALIPVLFGATVATLGDLSVTATSVGLVMSANVILAVKNVTNVRALKGKKAIHSMQLLSLLTPLCLIQILPLAWRDFLKKSADGSFWKEASLGGVLMIILSALVAFFMNLSNFLANRYSNPLVFSVVGVARQMVSIVLSVIIFQNKISLVNGLGIFITMVGVGIYVRVDLQAKALAAAAEQARSSVRLAARPLIEVAHKDDDDADEAKRGEEDLQSIHRRETESKSV